MKRIAGLVCILAVAAIMLAGCNKNTPKIVAGAWLTSFYHMDYEAAKKFSTEDTKNLLSLFEQFSGTKNDSVKIKARQLTVSIKDVKQEGDKATVTYSVSDNPAKQEPLQLVKQNDKWLVEFSKQDQGASAAAEQAAPEQAAPADSASIQPADAGAADSAKR